MKLSPRTKKFLTVGLLLVFAITLTGCSTPTDADGNMILISKSTSFMEVMQDESWFSALFVWPLAWLINNLSEYITVGGAIITVTALVNGIVAILTLNSTIQTQQMQLIQPEIEKIQRKYEGRDDQTSKMRMASETQALYSKYNINPVGTLLSSFIQFPIIIAMYQAVRRSEAVATGVFLGIDLQVTPLAGMQRILSGDMSAIGYIVLFIVMALCQAGSMMLPMWIQKRKAKREAEKHHRRPEPVGGQQKMMQFYMLGMIIIFGLMWPSAMSLYWAINSLVNIVKTLVVQSIIDKRQKEGK